jgi:hypothetical protein
MGNLKKIGYNALLPMALGREIAEPSIKFA